MSGEEKVCMRADVVYPEYREGEDRVSQRAKNEMTE